jgi:hypothetical protein
MSDRPQYVITLTPTGAGPPPIHRLRHLLKIALRTCGLRCIRHEEVAPPASDPPAEAGHAPRTPTGEHHGSTV